MDADNAKWEAMQRALSRIWLQRLAAYYRGDPMLQPRDARMFRDMRNVEKLVSRRDGADKEDC